MKVVLDTNIFLAAFFNRSFVFELLTLITRSPNEITIYTSWALKSELKAKIAKYLQESLITNDTVLDALTFFDSQTILVFPKEKITVIKRDKDDNKVLECAVKAGADVIITMDKDLLQLKSFRGIAIIHPKTFYYMLPPEGQN